jgi:hypothetical protein
MLTAILAVHLRKDNLRRQQMCAVSFYERVFLGMLSLKTTFFSGRALKDGLTGKPSEAKNKERRKGRWLPPD